MYTHGRYFRGTRKKNRYFILHNIHRPENVKNKKKTNYI